jgi:SAM-dependent methyltransferase
LYAGNEYVGLDMSEGVGVDVVADLTKGTGTLRDAHFELAICCSVLEHVDKPWLFAANLTRLMRPGGTLFMSVPWVWRYHAYPDDYFRFSHRGVMALFEGFEWGSIAYSTNLEGELVDVPQDKDPPDQRLSTLMPLAAGKRKYLPYLMVNMLGTRKAAA